MANNKLDYVLQLADNALIYGHRLSEWTGHGPQLEVDMALSNISLDNIGAARSLYQYAAEIEGGDKTEDSYPYLRDVLQFKNVLLVEIPNGDFAKTIARSFYFDCFQFHFYTALQQSSDERLAAIAAKSIKEVTYHWRYSKGWVIKLGDGTEVSKAKMQDALNDVWDYAGELFAPNKLEKEMQAQGIAPDLAAIKTLWEISINEALKEATLTITDENGDWHHSGGKNGIHTEHLGFLLAELQFVQRAYPNSEW
jgi:ring-1,2-phenylacetyl-CoA epoxidase subunit PaaC